MKHAYASCEWELLKKFSRPEVKGQGHREVKCTFLADGTHRRMAVRLLSIWRRHINIPIDGCLPFDRTRCKLK